MFSKPSEPSKPQEPPHAHSFELIAKTIAESSSVIHKNPDGFISPSVLLGCTSYLWECAECSELRKEVLLGSEEPTLPNLLAKVNEQGPIKIIRDGKTYLIGPLEEPRQPGTLPIR